ncbi:MAG TPA: VTT domain-containing protein [Anaeromyxobacter sp.]|nr:VTT domain-containing protein [Anaeromyxobacter sp.]
MSAEARPPAPGAVEPPAPAARSSWRGWAAAFAAIYAANLGLAWVGHAAPSRDLEVLALLSLYVSLACTFLPLPTMWIVLWAARETWPIPVALVATIGTCFGNLHDYEIVTGLCRLGPVQRARRSRLYGRAEAWFRRAPFAALTVAAFLPLPVDVVRLLAVSAGYPRRPYVLATFLGRFPRYLAIALLGHELRPSNRAIFVVFLVMGAIALAKTAPHLLERWRARRAGGAHAGEP